MDFQSWLERYIAWLLRHSVVIVLATIAIAVAIGSGSLRLQFTSDLRAYFSPENPQLQAFETAEQMFDRQDTLYLLIRTREGDIFTPRTLTLIRDLTNLGWQVPYSRRVDSLANFQHTEAREDTLVVNSVLPAEGPLSEAHANRARAIALNEPALLGNVVAPNLDATGVNVFLTLPDALGVNEEVMAWARQHIPPLERAYPEVAIFIDGSAASNVALGEAVANDVAALTVLSYGLIALLLFALLRHLAGTVATLLVVTLSVLIALGVYGWSNATLAAVAGLVPTVVMTIAVADCVHVLSTYYYELAQGRAKSDALAEALRTNASPVLITSLTTSIGMMALNFSDSPPYRDLGNMVAVGVLGACCLSLTLLPALLAWMPAKSTPKRQPLGTWLDRWAKWLVSHHRPVLLISTVAVLATASQIPRNTLTERWHEYFDETFEVRLALDALDETFDWLHVLRVTLDSGTENGINEPDYLRSVEAFSTWLRAQPEVTYVASLTDTVRRINKSLHDDDPDWRRLPNTREEAAQYLLLYELSLPLGLDLGNTINVDRSATQLLVFVKRTDSQALIELDHRTREWLETNQSEFKPTNATGMDMMFAHINQRNIRGVLIGMALAMVLISLLLVFALGSLQLGLLSLLTNLAPAGLAYGIWGMTRGHIDLSASVVMCMSLGIVVDDTVHFLSKYQRARRVLDVCVADALRYAFNTVGVALTITTIVLVSGFLVLTTSHFTPTVVTGALLAMTLGLALVIDFLLLPALLLRWSKTDIQSTAPR
ncbi:MAG: MMPL family transporter [Pseudomonadota bacterium]